MWDVFLEKTYFYQRNHQNFQVGIKSKILALDLNLNSYSPLIIHLTLIKQVPHLSSIFLSLKWE